MGSASCRPRREKQENLKIQEICVKNDETGSASSRKASREQDNPKNRENREDKENKENRETEEFRIIMLGLNDSGKTTILYKWKLGEVITTVPTVGFNVESLKSVKEASFSIWDVGGQDKIRPLWRHFYTASRGVFYVVDSADEERLEEARDELNKALEAPEIEGVPLVVLANKQDLPGAVDVNKVEQKLNLLCLNDRKWSIKPTSAVTGKGMKEGLEIMAEFVKSGNT